jgi:hypothetical protein
MEYDEDVCTTLFWFDPLGFFVTWHYLVDHYWPPMSLT